jgi:hypothetical protein
VGDERDDDELDELVLADERAGCVVAACFVAAAWDSVERTALEPHAW